MRAVKGWKCNRCRQMQTRHTPTTTAFLCADGTTSPGFTRFVTDPTRRTQSFEADELALLHFIVTGLLEGKDVRMAVKHPKFKLLVRKAAHMRRRSQGQ